MSISTLIILTKKESEYNLLEVHTATQCCFNVSVCVAVYSVGLVAMVSYLFVRALLVLIMQWNCAPVN